MRIARHGSGVSATLSAVGSQIHPVFMLPPLATSAFGSILAVRSGVLPETFAPAPASLHLLAIFLAVYTAHVKDGYVDFYHRGEDDDHPLTPEGCRVLLGAATGGFAIVVGLLAVTAGVTTALVTLPTWGIAYFHAPQLDMNPVGATAGYPLGIGLALLGGYTAQVGRVDGIALGFAAVLFGLLSGVKVIDDLQDFAHDRSIAKRTVPVILGQSMAVRVAYGCMAVSLLTVIALAVIDVFPNGTILAPVLFGLVALATRRAGPEHSTMLLIRGTYLFLAVLVAAVWVGAPS